MRTSGGAALALGIAVALAGAGCGDGLLETAEPSDRPCIEVDARPISAGRVQRALRRHGVATFQAGCFVAEDAPLEVIGMHHSITCLVHARPRGGDHARVMRLPDGEGFAVANVECRVYEPAVRDAVRRAMTEMLMSP